MSKARDLADLLATGGLLADGAIAPSEITGVTATADELNILDGVTATAAELNILDGVTATTSEINYLDVTTLGTTEASKAVTADANGQVIFGELKETVYTLSTSGTVALDPANGSIQTCASAGPTFTDSLEAGQTLVLHVTGGDSSPVTWPTVTWVTSGGNVAPTATASDVFVFWKVSTTLYGAYVGNFV